MNDFLTVDQVAGVLDPVQRGANVVIPAAQLVIRELALPVESHDAFEPVDLCVETAIHHHVADLALSLLVAHTDQVRQSVEPDAGVVLFSHTHVVLDQLPKELSHVRLVVLSRRVERLVSSHLRLLLLLVHRHELIGQ